MFLAVLSRYLTLSPAIMNVLVLRIDTNLSKDKLHLTMPVGISQHTSYS